MENNKANSEAFPLKADLSQIKGLQNTHLLGNLKKEQIKDLYRYVPAEQLLNDIAQKQLYFVSPELWEDPYERRFISADFKTIYNYVQPSFACLCFTDDAYEMAAAGWRMYSTRERKTLVRVYYDTDELLNILNKFCNDHNLKLIISKVSYGLTTKELRDKPIENILGPSIKDKTKKFDDAHFLSMLSVKRKAFTFESEIRFFIVGDIKFNENKLLPIEVDMRQIINKVMIEPIDPKYQDSTKRTEYGKIKSDNDDTYKKIFLPLGIRAIGSTLYSDIQSNILIK